MKISRPLSVTEIYIFSMLLQNDTYDEIRNRTGYAISTLNTHIRAIYKKASVNKRETLMRKFTEAFYASLKPEEKQMVDELKVLQRRYLHSLQDPL
jgi:DNA-binding CsgD family transcriptional regulator